jgi:hypothetical protein
MALEAEREARITTAAMEAVAVVNVEASEAANAAAHGRATPCDGAMEPLPAAASRKKRGTKPICRSHAPGPLARPRHDATSVAASCPTLHRDEE